MVMTFPDAPSLYASRTLLKAGALCTVPILSGMGPIGLVRLWADGDDLSRCSKPLRLTNSAQGWGAVYCPDTAKNLTY